jgi:ubiquinone/menaquinone biosynthesis C-methylase UbiE
VPLDVLDIGCGTGFLSLLFAAARHRVTGVDMAPTMLARVRDKAEAQGLVIRFVEADAEKLDLAAASPQDLIVERHVIWTLPHPETALDTWRRLLRTRRTADDDRRPLGPDRAARRIQRI